MPTIGEKRAVLRLMGFEVRQTGEYDDARFEWISDRTNGSGLHYLSAENFLNSNNAWDSAWRYINGKAEEELDAEPWGER